MNLINKAFKKTLQFLFNRIFYVAAALLFQLAWVFLMVLVLRNYSSYISIGLDLLTVAVVFWIVNRRINPSYKLAWTILILMVPIFGLVIYLIFGRSRIASDMQNQIVRTDRDSSEFAREDAVLRHRLEIENPSVAKQSEYIYRYSGYPLKANTSLQYFQVGDDMFPVLIRELREARHFVFIEYFIINNGVMWNTILDILKEKAKQGVDIRILYDDFGCLTTLPDKYYLQLQEFGIKCEVFNRFRPFLNIIQNNRNHRKLCIIDGHTGFTGGINLADEYINKKKRFGHWKDTAVMLKGEAVWNMTLMFLRMWNVIVKDQEFHDYEHYMPHVYHEEPFEGEGYVQPFCDSPLDQEEVGENTYMNIINRATRYVYICTPYLIIDNEMMTALCLAAKSGIDVRIMTPGIPDKKTVFLLTQSYYRQLLEAGVKIYEYQPGFLHAKTFVCDDELAVVGTINLDYRSLYLHFEDGVWIYKNHVIQEIYDDFVNTIKHCKPVSLEFCRERNVLVRIMQNILRLFAPML
ncbi:MAG: cardiolipin synthase [Blautia sp.]|nr:cardiolipin synthase [Blautia sp.]